MNIQKITHNPYINNFNTQNFKQNSPSDSVIYTNDGYVKIPQKKYENNQLWSMLLVIILGIELAFAVYRNFKK